MNKWKQAQTPTSIIVLGVRRGLVAPDVLPLRTGDSAVAPRRLVAADDVLRLLLLGDPRPLHRGMHLGSLAGMVQVVCDGVEVVLYRRGRRWGLRELRRLRVHGAIVLRPHPAGCRCRRLARGVPHIPRHEAVFLLQVEVVLEGQLVEYAVRRVSGVSVYLVGVVPGRDTDYLPEQGHLVEHLYSKEDRLGVAKLDKCVTLRSFPVLSRLLQRHSLHRAHLQMQLTIAGCGN